MSRVPDENTPFLNQEEIDESEIISIIQQRRLSIASVGTDHIPPPSSFNPLTHSTSHSHLNSPFGNYGGVGAPRSRRGSEGLGLAPWKSTNSLDLSAVISNSNLPQEPETDYKTEFKVLLSYSIPLSITFLLQYSLTVASVFSVGRLGSEELAAVSLSSMTANISGYAIIQGISTCLDTLCAQSFGRKDYNMVGMHFMRCNYLLLMLFVPIFVLWFFLSNDILVFLIGEDQLKICHLASTYLKILCMGLPGFILFENAKHYLQSQGVFHASTYVLTICAPINIILNYTLVWDKRIGMGFVGAPLSVVITNWIMCIMLYGYIYFVNGYQCWPKFGIFDMKYFKHWQRMINLSIPGVLMVEAEWLAFEIITFTASQFGTDTLAAQSIVSTTCVIFYQIPFAMSIAASTRIAWFIGSASKKAAKISSNATILLSLVVGSINGVVLFTCRGLFASLYSSDNQVIKLASKVLIVGAVYQLNDALACLTAGILRGQGRQKIGGWLNLISYYLLALPLAFYLAFAGDLKLLGLWMGMLIALFILSMSQLYFVISSDWDGIIKDCIDESLLDNMTIDSHSVVPSMSSGHLG
ncbi:uncharacterized transporter [[Candida] jaroonii]|uniref:Uncharacterized transporter n=1 Tax=[Candida] jaroonii TaxID=467808 RepID=A0ACA9Y7I1_9ASCO|nr:uncharacterized transporter [[Candida] jaroonii]